MNVISHDTKRELARALGEAVLRIWSRLPNDIQHDLFEAAVKSQGEQIRPDLAQILHDRHPRTSEPGGKGRDVPEPDSLGG